MRTPRLDVLASRGASVTVLAKVVLYKRLLVLARYPVNTASQLALFLVIFAIIVFGGRAVAGPTFSGTLEGIIVGYFLWILSLASFSDVARTVMREVQWGTFERLYLSPYCLSTVMFVGVAVNLGITAITSSVLLIGEMLIAGVWVTVDLVTVLPIVFFTLLPAIGIGFVFAGLAVVYKRVENLFSIVNFVLVGLVAAPVGRIPWLKFLPMSQGSSLLRTAMTEGRHLAEFPISEIAVLVVTGLAYLGIGYAVFDRGVARARREGSMGHY